MLRWTGLKWMQNLSLELIFKGLRARCGIDFSHYRQNTIKRRLARRMAVTGCNNYSDYFSYLEKNPEEYEQLFKDLTIKVSRFFRNRAVFEILSDKIFPDIMSAKESKNDSTLRIWCTGCSFGEEVYSVAITLVEYLKKYEKKIANYSISIFGTDIDGEALKRARAGVYDDEAVKEVKREILNIYFSSNHPIIQSSNSYMVIDSIKKMVSFSEHDLVSKTKISPPTGIVANYDLILCRNLLIYFSKPLQKRAFSNLFNSLNPGGYLVLGKSESIPKHLESVLVPQNPRHSRVYKKI